VKDGHLEFKQRITDDLEFLRSSPLGQQTLAKMDELAVLNGGKVTIERGDSGNTSYVFGRTDQDELTPEAYEALTPSEQGIIQNGVAGLGANSAHIFYDPQSTRERADGTYTGFPVTGLFHEIGHAYNGATGTFLAGESTQRRESGRTDVVPHLRTPSRWPAPAMQNLLTSITTPPRHQAPLIQNPSLRTVCSKKWVNRLGKNTYLKPVLRGTVSRTCFTRRPVSHINNLNHGCRAAKRCDRVDQPQHGPYPTYVEERV